MMRIVVIALALTACQHANSAVGPTLDQLVAAMRSNPDVAGPNSQFIAVRNVQCFAIEEEPTEFSCRAETQEANGAWTTRTAIVADDRDGWLLLSLE